MTFAEVIAKRQKMQEKRGLGTKISPETYKKLKENFKAGKYGVPEIEGATSRKLGKLRESDRVSATFERDENGKMRRIPRSLREGNARPAATKASGAKRAFTDLRKLDEGTRKACLSELAAYREEKAKKEGTNVLKLSERQAVINKVLGKLKESGKAPVRQPRNTRPKKEINPSLRLHEAKVLTYNAKRHLREGDMTAATADTTQAIDAVNDLNGATAVPENIKAQVQQLKSTIDDLAVQCGIEPTLDLGASPDGTIPPVDGNATETTPVAGDGTMLPESLRITRSRIAERKRELAKLGKQSLKEDSIIANTNDTKTAVGPKAQTPVMTAPNPVAGNNGSSETLKDPSLSEAKNGSKTAAKTWPTKTVKEPGTTAPGKQGKGFKGLKENLTASKGSRLQESASEKMVSDYLGRSNFSIADLYKDTNFLG